MYELVQSIPGHRDGYGDLILAVVLQAARDLNSPTMCSHATNWFFSDEFEWFAAALGIDPAALIRKLFLNQLKNWKNWRLMAKTFKLVRHADVSGVSGTGIVAEGVTFNSGQTVICWTRPPYTLAVYTSLEAVLSVHGHDGLTQILWDTPPDDRPLN